MKIKNRFSETFKELHKKNNIAFIPFWVLNYPTKEKSLEIIEKISEYGDILELGIPFSDPVADGPVIEEADMLAIKNGSTTKKALDVVKNIRDKFPNKPIGLLVYFNLILAYGIKEFFELCKKSGVDSILIPEIPVEEINRKIKGISVKNVAEKNNIDLIFIVSTNTPRERRKEIYENSNSFIYTITDPGITGIKDKINEDTKSLVLKMKKETKIPVCLGFGISKPEHISILKKNGADGAIVGSKLFKIFNEDGISGIKKFCEKCKKEV